MTQEKKTCKKRLSTKEERARQTLRVEGNKARRAKARLKRWAKRRLKTEIDPGRKGSSFVKNFFLRKDAEQHTIRRVTMKGESVAFETKPSIGLLKQREGTPTNWKMPSGWQASPETT